MKYALYLAITILAGCSRPTHTKVVSIDSSAQDYVTRFLDSAKNQGVNLNIEDLIVKIGDLGPPNVDGSFEAGLCTTSSDMTPTVTLNSNLMANGGWYNYSDAMREVLIYHELGHCVLGRAHTGALYFPSTGGVIADSIMNPYLPDPGTYIYYHDHYIAELFHGA